MSRAAKNRLSLLNGSAASITDALLTDKIFVSRFAQDAENILAAAQSAGSASHMTILIGHEGQIHMIADSDWPLDSLTFEHGAKTAYRVTEDNGSIRVEGREGFKTFVMESSKPARIARFLLGA